MADIADVLSKALSSRRHARGLSMRQAAKEAGVSHTLFARAEQGVVSDSGQNAIALCLWAGLSLEQQQKDTVQEIELLVKNDFSISAEKVDLICELVRLVYNYREIK